VLAIREGTPADAAVLLGLFDEAVAWLVARGQTGQWGAEPFSARPSTAERVRSWARGGGLRVAQEDGEAVGALVLGRRPAWVPPVPEAERYVEALVTSRRHAGRGVGAALLRRAREEARAGGVALLRVDCWAGAPGLVAWYERQGFTRAGTFEVDGWRGQVLEAAP
jgi:GNAT superfamily N-acetyltransferase